MNNNDKYIDNSPNPSRLIEALRSMGYDNYSAICDLIDNSFDANADIIKVDIGASGVTAKEHIISIADNGTGMTRDVLDQAMRLGSLTSKGVEDLGKFGMGLITASISLARRLTVITKCEGKFLTAIQDIDDIVKSNAFKLLIRESNDIEIARFEQLFGSQASGTIVTLQKVDRLKNKHLPTFEKKLIKDCGQIYRYFINSNKKIFINSNEVRAFDPMILNESEIWLDESKDFEIGDGKVGTLRLRVVLLPKLSAVESKDAGFNISKQGFYIIRNNREISSGQSLDLFSKHNDYNRFRAEIFFNSEMDNKMGVDITKGGAGTKEGYGLSEDARQWIGQKALPNLLTVRAIAKKEQKSKTNKVNHDASAKAIANKASVLKVPRLDSIDLRENLKGVNPDAFTSVDYGTETNTRLAPLFRYEVKGKDISIIYNTDHPFYELVFPVIRDNPDLTNAVDHVIYSMAIALINITSKKDLEYLQDEFMDRFSDNLRALLS